VQVWFKNRRAKCRQQQKAAEQVSKSSTHVHHQQQRPNSASSVSNSSPGGTHLPVGAAVDGDGGGMSAAVTASDDDIDDDRLLYRHHGGGSLLMASSTVRPSCGWAPASLPPLLRQSSDTFPGPYRVGPRLHSAPGYSSAAAAAMFASRSGGYPSSPYGSGSDLGGYGTGGWNVSVTQKAYCNGAGDGSELGLQFPDSIGSTSMSYGAAAVPLFVASPYDHGHHHIQHYQHQHHKQQLDDDLDDDDGDFNSSNRVSLQSADENKDWIKYQPL